MGRRVKFASGPETSDMVFGGASGCNLVAAEDGTTDTSNRPCRIRSAEGSSCALPFSNPMTQPLHL